MSQQFNASPDNLTLAVDCTADFETVVNRWHEKVDPRSRMALS